MFPLIYAIVQVTLDYLPILLLPWLVSAVTSALLLKGWKDKNWYLCFVPGMHTALKLCYATSSRLPLVSALVCAVAICTRSTVLCVLYLLLVCVYNVIFVQKMFIDYKVLVVPFGVYRLYLYWREIFVCLRCNKEKSTKKTTASKRKKSTKMKNQISK